MSAKITTNRENTSANLRGMAFSWKKRVMMAVSTTAIINCFVNLFMVGSVSVS
jgi:hypothetical protein